MYIPEFWIGVACTLAVECITLIVYSMIVNWRRHNGK